MQHPTPSHTSIPNFSSFPHLFIFLFHAPTHLQHTHPHTQNTPNSRLTKKLITHQPDMLVTKFKNHSAHPTAAYVPAKSQLFTFTTRSGIKILNLIRKYKSWLEGQSTLAVTVHLGSVQTPPNHFHYHWDISLNVLGNEDSEWDQNYQCSTTLFRSLLSALLARRFGQFWNVMFPIWGNEEGNETCVVTGRSKKPYWPSGNARGEELSVWGSPEHAWF